MGLSGKERDRLVVLRQVREGKLAQRQAAEQLKVSTRWVKKLIQRLKKEGDRALAHRLRGKVSNRKLSTEVQQRAMELVASQYADYGPTQAAEMLAPHGIEVSRETMRKWMSTARIWKPKRAKLAKIHVWRPRRAQRGELVQWDTSEHHWLEERGPKLYLIAMIDDATSELTARFAAHDSTEENMRLLKQYLEQHGRPVEFYTDKASLFQINRPLHYNKHLPESPAKTQIGRALEELGIGWIAAHSPQAKGRVERCFGTLQDRLVKALRRANARSLEQANEYLSREFLQEWNRRWRKEPAVATDAHRALQKDRNLASILSHVEQRTVTNDYTVSWLGRKYQLPAEHLRPRMRGAKARVEWRLDGELVARWEQWEIPLQECAEGVETKRAAAAATRKSSPKPAPGPKRNWMQGFFVGDPAKWRPLSPATPVALRAPSVTGETG